MMIGLGSKAMGLEEREIWLSSYYSLGKLEFISEQSLRVMGGKMTPRKHQEWWGF